MKRAERKLKRALSWMLMAAMLVTSAPETLLTASAQESENPVAETAAEEPADTATNAAETSETKIDESEANQETSESDEVSSETSEPDEETTKTDSGDAAEEVTAEMDTASESVAAVSTVSSESDFTISNGELTKYSGTATEIVIPDSVTSIGKSAFQNNTTITSVTFTENVTTIKSYAFYGCTSLKSVTFSEGLQVIEQDAFENCTALQDVTLPSTLTTIGAYAFKNVLFGEKQANGTINYGSLTIPASVTSLGNGAFYNCTYLQEVTFAEGTSELSISGSTSNYGVFAVCENLKTIAFPNRLTTIPQYICWGDTSLETVTFGNAVTSIETCAFENCTSLKGVTFPSTLSTIGNYAFKKIAFGEKKKNGDIEGGTLTIPSSVTSIGTAAFYGCEYLQEVVFLDDTDYVLTISDGSSGGYGAFADCENLKKITFPDRLKSIPAFICYKDEALETVIFGNAVTTIGEKAFKECTGLKSAAFPDSLLKIGYASFEDCSSLKDVTLPKGLETIDEYAFKKAGFGEQEKNGNISYGTLTIPGSVTSIGTAAFYGCTYLQEVVFLDDTDYVLTITDGSSGGYGAFAYCTNLKTITLPNRLKTIPAFICYKDEALETVTFGNAVTTIGEKAFKECTGLKSAAFPDTLEEIGYASFEDCKSLKDVTLPKGLNTIGDYAFKNVGFGEQLSNGTIKGDTLTIPGSVTSIGIQAFYGCTYLQNVIFTDDLDYVLTIAGGSSDGKTFEKCTNLKTITFPSRLLETIPAYICYGDTSLEEVYLGTKTTTIGRAAFEGCTKLTKLYIPESVTSINDTAVKKSDSPNLVIYGENPSAAYTFAVSNDIPFKKTSELGFLVTGISLYPTSIEQTEEAIGKTIQLTATVKPSTAKNKSVTYTSDNEAVATVDAKGIVTLKGSGTATITATSAEGNYSASCTVTVLKQWTDEEKAAYKTQIEQQNTFVAVTNVTDNLQDDLKINTGDSGLTAAWKLPYTLQAGTNDDYDIVLSKEGYQDAILEGIKVTGIRVDEITISGSQAIEAQKSAVLTAAISVTGESGTAQLNDVLDYEIRWESAKTSNATVKAVKDEATQITGMTAEIAGLKASKGNQIAAKLVAVKGGREIVLASANIKVDVLASGTKVVDAIEVTAADSTGKAVTLDELRKLINVEAGTTYTLQAKAASAGAEVADCTLTWKSSDAKVADIKAGANGMAVLTIKAKGSATISVTAAKNGGYSKSFKVTVVDSTPRLETNSVTLNLYMDSPQATISILPSDGYEIYADTLKLVNKDGTDSDFSITKAEGNQYIVGIKNGKTVAKGKQNLLLQVNTSAGETTPYELALTVQAVEQAPKITITNPEALNLYEKEGVGTLQIASSDAKIKNITFTPAASNGKPYLAQKAVDAESGTLTYKLVNASKENYSKAVVKGTLTVTFEGYGEKAAYNKAITLKVNKTLPKFTAAALNLYPGTSADTAKAIILDKDGNEITAEDGYSVTLSSKAKTPANYTITSMTGNNQSLTVKTATGAKKATLKLEIGNSDWIDGVKASASLSVKTATPVLSFSNANVTLSTTRILGTYDAVCVKPYIAGFEDLEFTTVTIEGKDAKSKAAAEGGNLLLEYTDGSIQTGIVSAAGLSGKYTYMVTAVTADGISASGKLTISIGTKNPDVTLKASGSIDLLNRETSGITYKIALKNYTDSIESVSLYGAYADCFTLDYEAGSAVAVLRAKEGKALKIKTAYSVSIKVTLESGVEIIKTVKVTPKQTTPKLTADVTKITLFESASGISCGKTISISSNGKLTTGIEKIALADGQGAFVCQDNADGTICLFVSADASAKTNKSYKLKLAVTMEDAAVNVAPVYVTVTVNYKK